MFFYKLIVIGIDLLIALSPIFIINVELKGLTSMWYFTIIFLCGCSCVDPFLTLIFSGNKLSKIRKQYYILKFVVSAAIILLALILPMQNRNQGSTLEQSNDKLFIIFSIFCFLKLFTVIDEIVSKNRILYNVLILSKQLIPFFTKIIIIFGITGLFYSFLGSLFYGG